MKTMILIADREEAIRDSLQYVLSEEGYAICTAASKEELLHSLHLHRYDLVIAEISMTGSNPEIFFDAISSHSPPPEVIVTISYEDRQSVFSLMRFGILEHLVKPFRFEDLLERVNRLLHQSHDQAD